ncbi:LamG-like jellyroll fold domain-containing protein [Flavilitoribacter nigricans]|uniref:LamG-like jellyroll fold domain-containing protein n=1 Tax=Flavilitoribacter nigricans (strain ATCC 23147 / DSM 23189 / NBRC 102662 / NCIMB 1420 / SS-2) TaxID=1122177 RepID=A0A2D0NE24_FLAN2|nr:LamG-like jellyroll fold domain-containing protein [Flavilitoribacter nigricans]PHN06626.1 hypothetical protein CRP01_10020 [Flavilitoribacter nigricans DSM 23189 = NBRC 102662]
MKSYLIYLSALLIVLFMGCNEGIDPITRVDPGPDQSAPIINIQYPTEGTAISVYETVTSINIKFEVTDDIEIATVKVDLDGSELASYSSSDFPDYRRFIEELTYDNLTDGPHVLMITGTDLDGKTTTSTVNFSKEPPYETRYAGEVFYMPFDDDMIDLVSVTRPTVVGNPGFAGESVAGSNAYAGAENAYLTFPTAGLFDNEFSAVFWMKVNAVPDRAGILVAGPEDTANPDAQNNRTKGFRFFRENAGGMQRFKLNVGRGEADSWFDGGAAADVDPNADEWVHFAFTIGQSEAAVYINGQPVKQGPLDGGMSVEGIDVLSIMSGAPRFTGWNHLSDRSYMDELRLFNRALSQGDILSIIADEGGAVGYVPKYDGETFYMPFDGSNKDLISGKSATIIGTPTFTEEAKEGSAYEGAEESYLTFPTAGLLGEEFSAAFWYKPNADPTRAGILVIGPPDAENPDAMNKRTSGFRFFREGGETNQIFKLNVGRGDGESWFDGGATATVDPTAVDWIHLAFTISSSESVVYINGEVVKQDAFTGVDWTDCDILSIMSGAPRFVGWNHKADLSIMDELRLFNKALTQEEVKTIIADEQ